MDGPAGAAGHVHADAGDEGQRRLDGLDGLDGMIIRLYAGGMTIRDLQHHLASLKWIPAAENVCLIGPAGTGTSHILLALGEATVQSGHRVSSLE